MSDFDHLTNTDQKESVRPGTESHLRGLNRKTLAAGQLRTTKPVLLYTGSNQEIKKFMIESTTGKINPTTS